MINILFILCASQRSLGRHMIVRPPLKLVVSGLLALACFGAVIFAIIPALAYLQDDVVGLVVDAPAAAADSISCYLTGRFRMVRRFGNVLYKAAQHSDLLHQLQPWELLRWCAVMTVEENLSVSLYNNFDYGFLMSPYNTVFPRNARTFPGHVFVTNFSSPGDFVENGFFDYSPPFAPANISTPWSRANTSVKFSTQPYAQEILVPTAPSSTSANGSQQSLMKWVSLSPRVANQSASSQLLYGGPVQPPLDSSTHQQSQQYLAVRIRGEDLSKYFATVNVSKTGFAVLIDVASDCFVAGGVSDPTGRMLNGTVPQLVRVDELQDARITSLLRAQLKGSGAEMNGHRVMTTCTTPCSLVFWPHRNRLIDLSSYHASDSIGSFDAFLYDFTAISVVQISEESGGALDLRLIVAVPSRDIIGALIGHFRWSIIGPVGVVVVACCVLCIVVTHHLEHLTTIDKEMTRLVNIGFHLASSTAPTVKQQHHRDGIQPAAVVFARSIFEEFDGLYKAVRHLSRELHILRAFSYLCCAKGAFDATLASSSRSNRTVPSASSMEAHHGDDQPFEVQSPPMPYTITDRNLWTVPVTCVFAVAEKKSFDVRFSDLDTIHRRHATVLTVLQEASSLISGASVDHFFGDRFLVHFNALHRTPKQVSAAVRFVQRCCARLDALQREARIAAYQQQQVHNAADAFLFAHEPRPVTFGVASGLAVCGFMGPRAMRVFTVVSPCVVQAGVMCRLATTRDLPVLLMWRSVTAARQEQQSSASADNLPTESSVPVFRAIAKVFLPGESRTHQTTVFALL
ncbi:membrane-associated protein, putative [Bodo saltans]|uniref:Membrane-associated protein, putative n=1 Tax=Bodo saltans TaxID=75058 RepID=A0A0S4IQ38_BODSA|nr:membrane-associated protein, putative [Bodo saltans]|eukprot:CUF19382.1 membrane-associated protein, putative [Bodo saltans]